MPKLDKKRKAPPSCGAAVSPGGSPAWGHPSPGPLLPSSCAASHCCFQISESIFPSHQRTARFFFGKEIFLLKINIAPLTPMFLPRHPIFRAADQNKFFRGTRGRGPCLEPFLPWAFTEWDFKAHKCVLLGNVQPLSFCLINFYFFFINLCIF